MELILNFLGSGILKIFGNSILQPILNRLNTRDTMQRDILIAQGNNDLERDRSLVAAEIQTNVLRAQQADRFAVLVYATAIPFIIHSGAVMLDSTFRFGWGVPTAPGPFADYEQAILLSFFILSPAGLIAKGLAAKLHR